MQSDKGLLVRETTAAKVTKAAAAAAELARLAVVVLTHRVKADQVVQV
jgi:hypothetical protein